MQGFQQRRRWDVVSSTRSHHGNMLLSYMSTILIIFPSAQNLPIFLNDQSCNTAQVIFMDFTTVFQLVRFNDTPHTHILSIRCTCSYIYPMCNQSARFGHLIIIVSTTQQVHKLRGRISCIGGMVLWSRSRKFLSLMLQRKFTCFILNYSSQGTLLSLCP